MSKLTKFLCRWLAGKLCPDLVIAEDRLFRLRGQLSSDRQWLGYDFPVVDIFAFRALVMDVNYGRSSREPYIDLRAGDVWWSESIDKFRDQLRKKFPAFSGWRLERSDSTPEAPAYFTATKPKGDLSTWTDDPERALQFARPEDAAAFAGMLGVKVHPVAVTLEAA